MIRFFFLLLSLSLYSFCYCELEKHLKKAEGKADNHKIGNIDFIYMINLDKRPEKYAESKEYLHQFGINPYRFSAVNGWELSIEDIQDVGVKFQKGMTPLFATTFVEVEGKKIKSHELMKEYGKTYFVHCMSQGAIGCALSHISVLQDAFDAGYQTIWVMEDDIEVLEDPHRLSELIDELDATVGSGNWDVLFTDYDYRIGPGQYLPAYGVAKRPDMDCSQQARYSDKYTKAYQISAHLRKIAARFGTTSMIIRRSGIVKLLEFAKNRNIYLPYQ